MQSRGAVPPTGVPSLRFGNSRYRILHVNDVEGGFDNATRLVAAMEREARQGGDQGMDVIRLHGGDANLEPKLLPLTMQLMKAMKLDAATWGNHDLSIPVATWDQVFRSERPAFPFLLSNLKNLDKTPLAPWIRPAKAIEVPTTPPLGFLGRWIQGLWERMVQWTKALLPMIPGVKDWTASWYTPKPLQVEGPLVLSRKQGPVGIIGVTLPGVENRLGVLADVHPAVSLPLPETITKVKAQVDALQEKGINKIIVLSHMGSRYDRQLAQAVPDIDVIVGGHTHETYYQQVLHPDTNSTVHMVQAGLGGEKLGVEDVEFDDEGHVVSLRNGFVDSQRLAPDPQGDALHQSARLATEKLGTFDLQYNPRLAESGPHRPGYFLAQHILSHFGPEGWQPNPHAQNKALPPRVDVAFLRPFYFRNPMVGPKTLHAFDVWELMPMHTRMALIEATGQELQAAMELSVQSLQKQYRHPGLLLPAGLTGTVNRGAWMVSDLKIQGQPLVPEKVYLVAVPEYTALKPVNDDFPSLYRGEHSPRLLAISKDTYQTLMIQALKALGQTNPEGSHTLPNLQPLRFVDKA